MKVSLEKRGIFYLFLQKKFTGNKRLIFVLFFNPVAFLFNNYQKRELEEISNNLIPAVNPFPIPFP